MTRKQIDDTLETWRQRLAPEWTVTIDWDKQPESENAHASVYRPDDYHRSHIRVAKDFLTESDEVQEQTLIHELLHLAVRDMDQAFRSTEGPLRGETYSVLEAQWEHAEEGFVDRLAWTLQALGR